jgi:hypothetical protein
MTADLTEERQMDAKRFVIGTVVGAAVLFATGYLIFVIALKGFLVYAMNAGSATGVARDPPLMWAVALGELSYSALITLAIGSRAGVSSAKAGAKIGAVVGFLVFFTGDFMLYGISHVGSLTSTVVDPLLELVPGAVAGAVIAVVLKEVPRAAEPTWLNRMASKTRSR